MHTAFKQAGFVTLHGAAVTAVPLVQANAEALPLATAVFDTVLATFPTDTIVSPVTLAAIYRVLKEDGRLVIIPEGHFTGSNLARRFIGRLYHITGQRKGNFALDEAHN